MAVLHEGIPKEIDKKEFEVFLQQVEEELSPDEFPEIFVQYRETDGKVIVLGIGESSDCAEQTTQALEKRPELKGRKLELKILRAPDTRFVLR